MVTMTEQYKPIDACVNLGNFSSAVSKMQSSKDEFFDSKDRVIYYLDLGLLEHYAGKYNSSNQAFSKAEDAIDELYTQSISQGVASLLLNDNALAYPGEDYENIYLNVFKALNFIKLHNFDDAFVEIRRMNNKLSLLEDKYQKLVDEYNQSPNSNSKFSVPDIHFYNSALCSFLSLILYRTEGEIDDARLDSTKIFEAFLTENDIYNFPMPLMENIFQRSGLVKVDILSFVGKSPEKYADNFIIHTDTNLLLVFHSDGTSENRIDAIPWPGINKDLHFKFSLPQFTKVGTSVGKVELLVDNIPVSRLDKIESIENVAEDTYQAKKSLVYLKTIVRAIAKGLINETANKELDKKTGGGLLGSLTRSITGSLFDATENADLRISRYFPSDALITEAFVKPGIHYFQVNYYSPSGRLLYSDNIGKREVDMNDLNLLESFYLQ